MQTDLNHLTARAVALQSRLDDLKDRRDRGRIDDGRYADLAADLDSERIQLIIEIRIALGGKDADLDIILQKAINGEPDAVLRQDLAEIAEKKGLSSRIIQGLSEHKGIIISWLVEIGLAIIKAVPK